MFSFEASCFSESAIPWTWLKSGVSVNLWQYESEYGSQYSFCKDYELLILKDCRCILRYCVASSYCNKWTEDPGFCWKMGVCIATIKLMMLWKTHDSVQVKIIVCHTMATNEASVWFVGCSIGRISSWLGHCCENISVCLCWNYEGVSGHRIPTSTCLWDFCCGRTNSYQGMRHTIDNDQPVTQDLRIKFFSWLV